MNKKKNSRISGFFKLSREKKVELVKEFTELSDKELEIIEKGFLDLETRDNMVENVIGTLSLPYSIAVNFLINKKDYLVPMVTEEPSVVAAACYGAKLLRENGGILAENLSNLMIGQIYLAGIENAEKAKKEVLEAKKEIIELANSEKLDLVEMGAGAKDLEITILKNKKIGSILRIHLLVDTKDAMGANTVNTMTESISPLIEKIVNKKAVFKIVSNLADKRLVKARGRVSKESLTTKDFEGKEVIEKIIKAQAIAETDIYRAVTNNKGILNGMGAVALATLNDWRALEAGAHGFAAKSGRYMPLASWKKDEKGGLVGEMTVPIAVGIVGGTISVHPVARASLKILGVKSAQELAQIIASVGLAQNLAALRALVSEGIQLGHMKLHNKNIVAAEEVF